MPIAAKPGRGWPGPPSVVVDGSAGVATEDLRMNGEVPSDGPAAVPVPPIEDPIPPLLIGGDAEFPRARAGSELCRPLLLLLLFALLLL